MNLLLTAFFVFLAPQDPKPPTPPPDKEPVTTASGLKYSILEPGEGANPKAGAQVKVHYTGWLADGTVFDSSESRGQPATFKLGMVIPGWGEGLQLMCKGARFKFTIPPELAYGKQGHPPVIPADSTLTFVVKLLDFTDPPAFHETHADAQKKTDSGLKYEVLKEGQGEVASEKDSIKMAHGLWTSDGKLLDWSDADSAIQAHVGDLRLKFMKEGAQLLKPGARYRFEVPADLAFGTQPMRELPAGSTTIWELEMLKVIKPMPLPAFVKPADMKLKKTESGLQYEVVKEGTGKTPTPSQHVTVHYAGWLEDGTPFDSSFSRGDTSEFAVGGVIAGWSEGLQLMKEGAIYRFVIPAKLGYGEQGSPPTIGPNATLVFYVQLVKVGD